MIKITVAMATAAVFLSPLASQAQTTAPPPPYGPGISLDDAKKMLVAAEAEAKKNGWLMAIAVVDSGGKLVAFSRMDNTQLSGIDIAVGKAVTANNFKRPTKVLQEGLAAGGASLRLLAVPGVTPIDGGLPIIVAGKIVGAIGVSGAAANQDGEVAAAGMAALTSK
jgi:glc operon protein GlcG